MSGGAIGEIRERLAYWGDIVLSAPATDDGTRIFDHAQGAVAGLNEALVIIEGHPARRAWAHAVDPDSTRPVCDGPGGA